MIIVNPFWFIDLPVELWPDYFPPEIDYSSGMVEKSFK